MEDFEGKTVAILGFGVEGKDAIDFFIEQRAKIYVFDEKVENDFDLAEVAHFEKDHRVTFFFGNIKVPDDVDLAVRSPGIPYTSQLLKHFQEKHIPITSATNLFFEHCPTQNIFGITGTKGKGTTSTLIYEMCKKQGQDAHILGNIGTPMLASLKNLTANSVVILELSSFQLEDAKYSPHIAVLLMITSEHLDHHADTEEYIQAKAKLVTFQDEEDYVVFNADYPNTQKAVDAAESQKFPVSIKHTLEHGCFIQGKSIKVIVEGHEETVADISNVQLVGRHNLENVTAAIMAAKLFGVSTASIQSVLKSFMGLEHRLEFVKEVKGVRYFNDSFSTTPETAIAAIKSFDEHKVLILGGSSKNSDFGDLGKVVQENKDSIRGIVGVGLEWSRIKEAIGRVDVPVVEVKTTMHDIVKEAKNMAHEGDVVLLSPACASFDMFPNYKRRGVQFKEEVARLAI